MTVKNDSKVLSFNYNFKTLKMRVGRELTAISDDWEEDRFLLIDLDSDLFTVAVVEYGFDFEKLII